MNHVLKAPGTILLKQEYAGRLSILAFEFNLRRYNVVNLARKGPALDRHAHKNMPLAAVLNAFL